MRRARVRSQWRQAHRGARDLYLPAEQVGRAGLVVQDCGWLARERSPEPSRGSRARPLAPAAPERDGSRDRERSDRRRRRSFRPSCRRLTPRAALARLPREQRIRPEPFFVRERPARLLQRRFEHLLPTRRIVKGDRDRMLHEARDARRFAGGDESSDFVELIVIERDGDFGRCHTRYHTTPCWS
jgi:hypothetical protein